MDETIWPQAAAKTEKVGSLQQTVSETLSQAVRELLASVRWGHHRFILDKLTDPAARLYCRPRNNLPTSSAKSCQPRNNYGQEETQQRR